MNEMLAVLFFYADASLKKNLYSMHFLLHGIIRQKVDNIISQFMGC